MKNLLRLASAMLPLLALACAHVTVAPMKLQITHDINIHVDKQLEDFFSFERESAATRASATPPAATLPAAPELTPQPAPAPGSPAVGAARCPTVTVRAQP